MKYLLLSLFFLSSIAMGDSLEVLTGGITYHLFMNPEISAQFSNKLNGDGSLIFNQLYGLKYTKQDDIFYSSYSLFGGNNSIAEPMGGALYSFGIEVDHIDLGIAAGGYLQDASLFQQRGIDTTSFMPILGFECNYKIDVGRKYFVKINNLLSVLMYNLSASIGKDF